MVFTGPVPVDKARALFREMAEDDGQPAVGAEDLGVRVGIDVTPDSAGMVPPHAGGMSVVPDDPRNLHRAHRPRSLGGTGSKPVWTATSSSFSDPLTYRPDARRPGQHGFIEPVERMLLDAYVAGLEKTRATWDRVDV